MPDTQVEKRRSFRVSESAFLRYEVLSELDFNEGLERRKIRLGIDNAASAKLVDIEARLSQELYLLNAESALLGKCIGLLNDKLNLVVNEMPGIKKAKSSLASLPPQVCEVSADGMVFSADESLEQGTKLYLEFLLASDNRYVEVFCEVQRMVESPDPSAALAFGIAVEFRGMKPELREVLIQHMFNRESETLRMRRLNIEAMQEN